MMKCTSWLILNDSHRDIHKTGDGAHEQCVKEGEEVPLLNKVSHQSGIPSTFDKLMVVLERGSKSIPKNI